MHALKITALAATLLVASSPAFADMRATSFQDVPENVEQTDPFLEAATWSLVAQLDDAGQPVLDENGAPVIEHVAMDDATVVPGDTVLTEMTLVNPTDQALNAISLDTPFSPAMRLDPQSFAGPEGTVVSFATQDEPDVWHTIHPAPSEVERETMPSLDDMHLLRVMLPLVPAHQQALVSYAADIRQGVTTTTNLETN